MGSENVTRKLAAILYADVAGYSRLTGADEEGTHRTVSDYLDAIADIISGDDGRVVHYAGDAVLADFASVVAAVKCAIAVQRELAARNADIPDNRKVRFRIGVNLGDVIVDRDDIYGTGVNVAARLESLADPGGICVSGSVLEQVEGKVDVGFEDMGPQAVKNIEKPVQAYRVVLEGHSVATPPLPLPDKPSIAVLPFDNLGSDPSQDFFGDGIAEDIITELSRFHSLFVIARGSSFSFKGESLDTREIAATLGVRYILEGSVRTHGSRIRITAQLIDAETEIHIWAERYDRDLEDTFAIQDEVTNAIVLAIAPKIDRSEGQRARRKPPESLDAWTQYQQGLAAYYLSTEAGLRTAAALFDRSTEMDPSFATAYGYAAASRNRLVLNFGVADSDTLVTEVKQRLDAALALDPQNVVALFVTGVSESMRGNHDVAVDHVRQAIALNPNSAYSHGILSFVLRRAGRPAEAVDAADRAMRLSPYDPAAPMFLGNKARAHFDLEQYADAIEWCRRAVNSPSPHPSAFITLAAALCCCKRRDEAGDVLEKLKRQFPDYSLARAMRAGRHSRSVVYGRVPQILRKAGLAE